MILTLEETLASQESIEKLCAERTLETSEIFVANAWYGMSRILKEYVGIPQEQSLKVVIPHGICLSPTHVWEEEVRSPLPAIYCYPAYREAIYLKSSQDYKNSQATLLSASPFVYLTELLKNCPQPTRKGTLFFPPHSTGLVTVKMDLETLAEQLAQLDEEYQPVTVCVYWKDFNLGLHQPFQKKGFPIVSAGHIYDSDFLFRLYHLFSLHKYAASTTLGSHIFYAVQSGCSYFHLDANLKVSHTAKTPELVKQDVAQIPNSIEEEIQSVFARPHPEITVEQKQLVDRYLGTQYFKSPQALRQQLFCADTLYKNKLNSKSVQTQTTSSEEISREIQIPPLLQINSSSFGSIIPFDFTENHRLKLNEIHSDAHPYELDFLYKFFTTLWSGQKNVCEIGPYFGATTRAIAMGMLANPRRQESCKLYTYDRFENYGNLESNLNRLKPLISREILDRECLEKLQTSGSFFEIFQNIHKNQPYSSLVVARKASLPPDASDLSSCENSFKIDGSLEFDAVFVDGCKSWYATKYFMLEIGNCVQPGTHFIFQDYGWYTCFWIPSFVYLMQDYFKLVCYVHDTYVWQLNRPLNLEILRQRYPDNPNLLDRSVFDRIFRTLIREASTRSDRRAFVMHTIHHAAALAYIGYQNEAKDRLSSLFHQPWIGEYKPIVQQALHSPTYYPDGNPIILK
ncbi:MAG TPA: hypothetical protein IGS17_12215 [Oscillatoriales cyanobacterium M59_W2019_021]|nr:hypothetical protein [Oscillatoriales cyanobacterium M4454_W2019_049]HIK51666.1 hypothetical protein [Oscillatoriales cyanobacterium M59_W2019_021]